MSTTGEFGRGKTIFVLAIVIGCFAVLWPKIFYPMLTASISSVQDDTSTTSSKPPPLPIRPNRKGFGSSTCCDVISEKDTNAYKVMNEICTNIMRKEQEALLQQQQQSKGKKGWVKVSMVTVCRNEILQTCGVDIISLLKEDHSISTEYKKSLGQLRSFNTSLCMKLNYGVDFREIGLPRKIKGPEAIPNHMRPERAFRPGPDMVHPALRERGKAIPTVNIPRRTIEREARPGPVPGMRPPVGGAGHIPSAPKGGGTMGIIMPMYTIGIVCFFLYTIMKILFKKAPEDEQGKPPLVKDYGMDPEHRKYVFSEEYQEGSERSMKEAFHKEDRDMGLRRRPSGGKTSRFYEDRRRLDEMEIPVSPPPPPTTPAVSSMMAPPSFPFTAPSTTTTIEGIAQSQLPQEFKDDTESVVTAVKGIVEAFDSTKPTTALSSSSPPTQPVTAASTATAGKPPQENLEDLIASAEKGANQESKVPEPTKEAKKEVKEEEVKSTPAKTTTIPPSSKEKAPSKSTEKEVKFKLPPEEMEEEEEIEEEVEIVRPPTPPKTLSKAKPKSSTAAAAIAQAKAGGGSTASSPTPGVSIIGIEETACLSTGERWDMTRTPTPTFRMPTPPVPHRPPSPPDNIPSIYLEGPFPHKAQDLVVRQAQSQIELDADDYDFDDEYEASGPVILSGKVTLSVISSVGPAFDEETEAPSLSDDKAQAEQSKDKSASGSRRNVTGDNVSGKSAKGKSKGNKSSNLSSPDMDEYEVIGKGESHEEDDVGADVSLEDFLTATDAEDAKEDTAADISTMDDLKPEPLPQDEE